MQTTRRVPRSFSLARSTCAALLAVAPLVAACEPTPSGSGQGTGGLGGQPGGGAVDDGQDLGPDDQQPTDPQEPVEAPRCPDVGGISYERPEPNVMLLVDKSGSMGEPDACGQATCPSKWSQLPALGSYLNDVKQAARLGLAIYPTAGVGGCSVTSNVMVPLTDSPAVDERILNAVASIVPDGRTPIPEAIDELAARGGLDDPLRDNVIVLLTDGMPNCSCDDNGACERERAVEAVERLADRAIPIRMHVVGFGSGAQAASDTLTAMAAAAGTAPAGPVGYYQASNIEELIGRLYQVAADLAPCRFNLDEWPEAGDLKVWLDDALVPPCTAGACDAGYTYDTATGVVELHGASCQAIRDGACHSVWFDTEASE